MITITILKNRKDEFLGFSCLGHAGFADAGEDIVCAGVSVLVINTINSIASFTSEVYTTESDEDMGNITLMFEKPAEADADLLMRSLVLGLQGIQHNYGNEYIKLNFKEV